MKGIAEWNSLPTHSHSGEVVGKEVAETKHLFRLGLLLVCAQQWVSPEVELLDGTGRNFSRPHIGARIGQLELYLNFPLGYWYCWPQAKAAVDGTTCYKYFRGWCEAALLTENSWNTSVFSSLNKLCMCAFLGHVVKAFFLPLDF